MSVSDTTTIAIGGKPFTVGKIRLGVIRRNPEAFAILEGMEREKMPTQAQFDAMITIVHEAIVEPKITRQEFLAIVDDLDYDTGVTELVQVIKVAMMGSGLVQKENASSGEGQPAPAEASSPSPESASSTA